MLANPLLSWLKVATMDGSSKGTGFAIRRRGPVLTPLDLYSLGHLLPLLSSGDGLAWLITENSSTS